MSSSKLISVTLAILVCATSFAQKKAEPDFSIPFASYADTTLEMDVYLPHDSAAEHYCIIHTYGGGFVENYQKETLTRSYCRRLADEGYVVVASNYRPGLKGVKMKSKASMLKPLRNAIAMGVEDIYKVTNCVLEHASDLEIRPDGIILSGSSAGAIISLHCDYFLCNKAEAASILPEDFHYAGVISFSGAILSQEGKCDYKYHSPAPTMFLHGEADKLVTYNRIKVFRNRFSGSNDLVKRFAKFGWSYEIIRFEGEGHGVSARLLDNFDDVIWFLDNFVKGKHHYEIDKTIYDREHPSASWDKVDAKTMY